MTKTTIITAILLTIITMAQAQNTTMEAEDMPRRNTSIRKAPHKRIEITSYSINVWDFGNLHQAFDMDNKIERERFYESNQRCAEFALEYNTNIVFLLFHMWEYSNLTSYMMDLKDKNPDFAYGFDDVIFVAINMYTKELVYTSNNGTHKHIQNHHQQFLNLSKTMKYSALVPQFLNMMKSFMENKPMQENNLSWHQIINNCTSQGHFCDLSGMLRPQDMEFLIKKYKIAVNDKNNIYFATIFAPNLQTQDLDFWARQIHANCPGQNPEVILLNLYNYRFVTIGSNGENTTPENPDAITQKLIHNSEESGYAEAVKTFMEDYCSGNLSTQTIANQILEKNTAKTLWISLAISLAIILIGIQQNSRLPKEQGPERYMSWLGDISSPNYRKRINEQHKKKNNY